MHAITTLKPDSRFVAHVAPSPNHDERTGVAAPDILLLHYTGMRDMQSALDRLLSREARVSSHYLVCEDGVMLQLDAEGFAGRDWHTLVLDEAQAVKNAAARRSQAVHALRADFPGSPASSRCWSGRAAWASPP